MNGTERVLHFKLGDRPLGTTGLVDRRIFTGENKITAIMDKSNCLWSLKYDSGSLPEPLRQQFTSFNIMMTFLKEYFKKRNIEVNA